MPTKTQPKGIALLVAKAGPIVPNNARPFQQVHIAIEEETETTKWTEQWTEQDLAAWEEEPKIRFDKAVLENARHEKNRCWYCNKLTWTGRYCSNTYCKKHDRQNSQTKKEEANATSLREQWEQAEHAEIAHQWNLNKEEEQRELAAA